MTPFSRGEISLVLRLGYLNVLNVKNRKSLLKQVKHLFQNWEIQCIRQTSV